MNVNERRVTKMRGEIGMRLEERRSDRSDRVSSRHTEGETDRAERTAEAKRETEQEAMVRGKESEREERVRCRDGQGWGDGCGESAEDRQMKGRT